MLGFSNMTADFWDVSDYVYELTPEGPVLVQVPKEEQIITTPSGEAVEISQEPESPVKKGIPWWIWAILAGVAVAEITKG